MSATERRTMPPSATARAEKIWTIQRSGVMVAGKVCMASTCFAALNQMAVNAQLIRAARALALGAVQIAGCLVGAGFLQRFQRLGSPAFRGRLDPVGAGGFAIFLFAHLAQVDDFRHGLPLGTDHILGPDHAVKGFPIDIAQRDRFLP